jgi:hypothetical protein
MTDMNPYEFRQGNEGQGPVILPPMVVEKQVIVKPTSVTVFGVLNCVFGGLFFVCVPVGVFFILMAGKIGETSPEITTFDYISLAIVFGLSVWEIITGIGLLKFVSWARRGTIIYAVCDIIWVLVNIIIHITTSTGQTPVPEGTTEFQAGYQVGYHIGQSCGMIFTLIYPVLLLIFMQSRKVKEAFAKIENG